MSAIPVTSVGIPASAAADCRTVPKSILAAGITGVRPTSLSLAAPKAEIPKYQNNPLMHERVSELRALQTLPLAAGDVISRSPSLPVEFTDIDNFPQQYRSTCLDVLYAHLPGKTNALKQIYTLMTNKVGTDCIRQFAMSLASATEYAGHQHRIADSKDDKKNHLKTMTQLRDLGKSFAEQMLLSGSDIDTRAFSDATNNKVCDLEKKLNKLMGVQCKGDGKLFGNRVATGALTKAIIAHFETALNARLAPDTKARILEAIKKPCGDLIEATRISGNIYRDGLFGYANDVDKVTSAARDLRDFAPDGTELDDVLVDGGGSPLPDGEVTPTARRRTSRSNLETPYGGLPPPWKISRVSLPAPDPGKSIFQEPTAPRRRLARPPALRPLWHPTRPKVPEFVEPEPDYSPGQVRRNGNRQPIEVENPAKDVAAETLLLLNRPDPTDTYSFQNQSNETVSDVSRFVKHPPASESIKRVIENVEADHIRPPSVNADDTGMLLDGLGDPSLNLTPFSVVQDDPVVLRKKVASDTNDRQEVASSWLVLDYPRLIATNGGRRQYRFSAADYAPRPNNVYQFLS